MLLAPARDEVDGLLKHWHALLNHLSTTRLRKKKLIGIVCASFREWECDGNIFLISCSLYPRLAISKSIGDDYFADLGKEPLSLEHGVWVLLSVGG